MSKEGAHAMSLKDKVVVVTGARAANCKDLVAIGAAGVGCCRFSAALMEVPVIASPANLRGVL